MVLKLFCISLILVVSNYDLGGAKVCDVTKYLNDHPGGAEIMLEFAGT